MIGQRLTYILGARKMMHVLERALEGGSYSPVGIDDTWSMKVRKDFQAVGEGW